MIRTLWVGFMAVVLTLRLGVPIVVASVLGARNALDRFADSYPRRWARGILRASGCTVRVEGGERLDPDRAQIIVANHVSWFDVFALAAHLPVPYRFVAKEELSRIPIFGAAWMALGHVAIDREDRAAAIESLERAGEQIRRKAVTVVMFPEGTRSPDGRLLPFKKGAFVLAIQAGAPVVPVAVLGTRSIMPKGAWRIRPGEILIRVDEPLSTEGMVHEDREELRRRARGRVALLLGGQEGATQDPVNDTR